MLAGLSVCVYGMIALMSWRFDYGSEPTDRPIVGVLCLFAVLFVFYVVAIRVLWRAKPTRRALHLVVGTAIVFRVVMLFSVPIQEVDIYRYLWDGAVSTSGVSPFQYSPQDVISAGVTDDEELNRLAELRDRKPVLAEILHRVHFPEIPTVYPPTSQFVFAVANLTTPSSASVSTRLLVMKAWLIGFDVATLLVVVALLRRCGMSAGLCVIYAWCPLIMKEFANSGHLDAIAVFLTTLGLYLVVCCFDLQSADRQRRTGWTMYSLLSAVVLGLAVGAKLYPIILAPLVFFTLLRKFGWRVTIAPSVVFVVTTVIVLFPMFPGSGSVSDHDQVDDPSLGVVTFLRQWEMNDFLFLIAIENLKPTTHLGPHAIAWFSVVPESIRESLVGAFSSTLDISPGEAPFMLARGGTAAIFFGVAMALAWWGSATTSLRFGEAAFLTIAWFWLLCPTLNPWYWTWALPLLPFARGRAWIAVSGLVFVYYFRFWLVYHFPSTAVMGTPYTGAAFYDFVVTWLEFAPWFAVLIGMYLLRRNKPNHAFSTD